ncbi:SDR family oxidoreductase [Saccharopolyspora sp. NPDC002578]
MPEPQPPAVQAPVREQATELPHPLPGVPECGHRSLLWSRPRMRLCFPNTSLRSLKKSAMRTPQSALELCERVIRVDRIRNEERNQDMTSIQHGSATQELKGKRALVTGGTRGIGAAIVRRFVEEGAEVLAAARSVPDTAPEGAGYVAADLRTPTGVEEVAAAALERLGGVDVLVHNAGGAGPHASALAISEDEWQDVLNLNLMSAVRLDALVAPGMRERRSGAIVHISSAAAFPPVPQVVHYTSTKAALENYSRGMTAELAPFGVRVNVVTPGRTDTPGGARNREEIALMGEGAIEFPDVPLGRDGLPEDIAEAVLFIVSDRASWIAGGNLVVDGAEFPRR